MRDRPPKASPQHKLEWPGGVVPEWARPQGNANKRFRKGKRGDRPGGPGGGGNSKRERLQKVMAQSGHGSRRNIEILIAQGHITINGQVAKLGDSVGPGDKVKLDGTVIRLRFGEPQARVLLYHKPEGEIVTRDDPEGRATVFEKLPKVQGGRWVSVGRLDLNTGGLLIFTTDGELANRLTHPRFEVEREYAVRVLGEITDEIKAKLLSGVEIEGETCKFDSIEDRGGEGANRWYHVVLREGKNREVRKMMEAVSLTVSRLMRVRFGSVALPGFLKRGMMREMNEDEAQELLAFAGMGEAERVETESAAEEEDPLDNVGNVAPRGEKPAFRDDDFIDEENDNVGNRADVAPREPDGNRDRQPQPSAPRQPGGGGQKRPFFKKRPGGPQQPQAHGQKKPRHGRPHGQGQGPAQGAQGAQGGQGQGHPQGQGQGQPQGQGPGAGPGPGGKPGRGRRNKNRNRNRGAHEARGDQQPANNGNRDPV